MTSTRGSCVIERHVELAVGGVPSLDPAVEHHPVAVHDAEHAVAARLERLQPQRIGLGHLARGVDLVVEDDHDAASARRRIRGDPESLEQVGGPFVSERARVAHRADDHDRPRVTDGQVEKVRELLERVGAAGDDDAGELPDRA